MKTHTHFLAALLLTVLIVQFVVAEPQIKLTGRKDLVLSVESRATVLDVARQNLSDKSDDFLASASDAETPYAFEQPVVLVAGEAPVEEVAINYDDASVLRAVTQNFAQQVRGTLSRGSTRFLQLKGGNMIKPGTSFPVTIPQAQGQTFTVTVTEITGDGYTLSLGEASETVSLNPEGLGQGAIRMD